MEDMLPCGESRLENETYRVKAMEKWFVESQESIIGKKNVEYMQYKRRYCIHEIQRKILYAL